MVRELARVLFGPDAMPHVELARWNREDVRGVARDDPILLSQGVRGRTLFEVLQSDDRDTVVKSLDAQSLSQAIVLAMLTMPEDGTSSQPLVGLLALSVIEKSHNLRDGDLSVFALLAGKPDNYVCEERDDGGGCRIVCIDNDHSFSAPFTRGSGNAVHLNVKSILFCMDQMHDAIHPQVRDALCSARFDPLKVMKEWLDRLHRINSQGHSVYIESRRTARDLWSRQREPSAIGIPFPPGVVEGLCNKLRRLQSFLGRTAKCTHMEILSEIEPLLAFRYVATLRRECTSHLELLTMLLTSRTAALCI
jgi:hypothetical protein